MFNMGSRKTNSFAREFYLSVKSMEVNYDC